MKQRCRRTGMACRRASTHIGKGIETHKHACKTHKSWHHCLKCTMQLTRLACLNLPYLCRQVHAFDSVVDYSWTTWIQKTKKRTHACMHTSTHTYMHAHTDARTHARMHACMHTHKHSCMKTSKQCRYTCLWRFELWHKVWHIEEARLKGAVMMKALPLKVGVLIYFLLS